MTATPPAVSGPEIACERALLGALLVSPGLADQVGLSPADLAAPAHGLVCGAIARLVDRGELVSPAQVMVELAAAGELGRAGGEAGIDALIDAAETHAVAANLAQVRRSSQVRAFQALTAALGAVAALPGADPAGLLARADAELAALAGRLAPGGSGPALAGSEFPAALEHAFGPVGQVGLSTALRDLDDITGGLHPGQLVVIAARPGVGKSALGLDLARAAAVEQHVPALLVSLEMTAREIVQRLLSAEMQIELGHLRGGLSEGEKADLAGRGDELAQLAAAPLWFADKPNQTLAEIRSTARRLHRQIGLGLLVVDYLQLIPAGTGRVENRQVQVAELSRGLKLLAKELGIPVVAMSQLNRASEARADKRPQLSDLRESGAIEQDADVVILIHREELSDPSSSRLGEADLIIAKHRNGPTGVVLTAFQGHFSRFCSIARDGA